MTEKNHIVDRLNDLKLILGDAMFYLRELEDHPAPQVAEARDAVAAAKLPVEGLSFGDGVVTMSGLPFDQASDAEKLRASVSIAMALNSKLKVVRIRDGSLLDSASMEIISKMAEENDCQVWIEKVDETGKVGFVIEEGNLKIDR